MILDTNALSAFADEDAALLNVLPVDRPWYLPVVVVGEYRFGLLGSRERIQREQWLKELLNVITVLEVRESTTAHYAAIRDQLKRANRQIPPNDSWIAALALEHQLPILTRNGHFQQLPGVVCLTW
jgi:tRNA(fMet)-specific endonuclease VapC